MTVLEKGKISLYEVIVYYKYSATTYWYVAKNSDKVSLIKTNGLFSGKGRKERKDDLAEMLKDQPAVYQKYMAEDKFNFKAIRNLVHLYNTGHTLDEEKK